MFVSPLRLWRRWTRNHRKYTAPRLGLRLRSTHLEDRVTPASLFGLAESGTQLVIFDSVNPASVSILGITGLGTDTLDGIDFRAVDQKLYGFDATGLRTYSINITTGAATFVGAGFQSPMSTFFGFDFNPVVDRIRVVGDGGNNLRINPNDGSLVMNDTALNGGATGLAGAAYTNNFAGTTTTTLYGIDAATDGLYIVNPPNGGVTTLVGAGLGFDTDGRVGFDIAFDDGKAYASLTVAGEAQLYIVDLTTGVAAFVGKIGDGKTLITGLSAKFTTNVPPVVTYSGTTQTYDIDTDTPVFVDPAATVTDLDSPNFGGGLLTVTLSGGVTGDLLDIGAIGGVTVDKVTGKVFVGGVEVGTYVTGSDLVPLVVTFNNNATVANSQAVFRAVTFSTTDDSLTPATRTVSATISDGDGGTGNSNTQTVNLADLTAPTVVTIVRADPSPTNAASVNFTVTFNEAVTGVDISDFTVTLTGNVAATVGTVTPIDAKTYTVTVNTPTGQGTVRLDVVDDDTIVDTHGNALGGAGTGNGNFTAGEVYTFDRTPPEVIILQNPGQPDPAFSQPVVFYYSFTEVVTGFTASDVIVNSAAGQTLNVTVTPVAGQPTDYLVSIDGATKSDTITVDLTTGSVTDLAGNTNPDTSGINLFDNKIVLDLDNDAPVVTAPASVSGTEEVAFTFTGADSISINDPDLQGGDLKVTLTATNGTLTLSGVAGLVFITGDGTGDASMSFTGKQADINAALLGLVFTPDANFDGAALVSISADDQGNTGAGGAKVGTADITVNLAGVNDAPTITFTGSPFTTAEDTNLTFATGSIVIADVDAGTGIIQVTMSVAHGKLTFTDASKLTFTTGVNGDASFTFTGTLADINAALDGLTFAPDANFNGSDSITVTVDDKGNTGTGGALTDSDNGVINITAVNDAPVNTVPATATVEEDKTFTFNAANLISIADVDVGTSALKITLTASKGTITLSKLTGLSFTTGDGTGDVTMTFTGNLTDINAALNGLVFTPDANFNGAASLKILTDDQGNTGTGGALTDEDTVDITVTTKNDVPVAGNDTFTTKQNQSLTINPPGVLGNDTDADNSTLTAVLVTNVPASSGTLTLSPNGGFVFTPAINFTGVVTFQYKANDGVADSNVATVTITVSEQFTRLFATGAGAGGGPHVVVHNADGSIRFSFYAFDESFTGGVSVATGDVNGDGVEDIIVGAGAGGTSHVRVLSGVNLAQIHNFVAFDPDFAGGSNVATGDVNGDGFADVIVGAGTGGGPHVKVFSGQTGGVIQQFFAYDEAFLGGVNVAAGEYDGDGRADIVTGAGPGGTPHVIVYKGMTGGTPLKSFFAFDRNFSGGVRVAAGEFNNAAAIFVAAGSGGVPVVSIFDFATATEQAAFFAFAQGNDSGVHIGTEVATDGTTLIYLGGGTDEAPEVRVLDANTLADRQNFSAYDPAFLGGVFIG